jgi:hypothetical protein
MKPPETFEAGIKAGATCIWMCTEKNEGPFEFGFEKIGRGPPIDLPPLSSFADMRFRDWRSAEAKAHALSLEALEHFPSIDRLAPLGLGD